VTPALTVVAWIGAGTMLLASFMALGQADIKRILAYSTVSQLGLMMLALGVGSVAAAIMHLLAHGFFKALLFLGSGSVIHGCHHEQDIRRMGGLRRAMPVTFLTYTIGMMALAGVPLFFSGAWTKEEILHAASKWPTPWPYWLGLAGVVLTALYMTRQMTFVFFGQARAGVKHAHESKAVMTLPLVALAICTVVFSVVLTPAWPWLDAFLSGHPVENFEFGKMIQPMIFTSLVLVGAGIAVGAVFYKTAGETDPLQRRQPALFRIFENKFWLDEIYAATVLALAWIAARVSDWMDRCVWDGLVRFVGASARCLARQTTNFDEGGINAGGDTACDTANDFGAKMSAWHSGHVQTYLRTLGLGALALLAFYVWLT
jgi:NADH-quinone oxidoreductase subunit L